MFILRLNTSLSIAEKALGKAVLATGTPTVVVVVNGGAVSFDTLVGPEGGGPRAAAVVEAGYACDNMRALAELMFGDSSKWRGKLLSHFHNIKTICFAKTDSGHTRASAEKEGVSLSAGASLPTRSTLRRAPTATFHATFSRRLNVLAAASLAVERVSCRNFGTRMCGSRLLDTCHLLGCVGLRAKGAANTNGEGVWLRWHARSLPAMCVLLTRISQHVDAPRSLWSDEQPG